MFFNTASAAYLPTIVPAQRLVAANSALSASAPAAEFTGFGISGFLVQLLSAPIAIAPTITALPGAIGGGILAEVLGLRGAMAIGVLGAALGIVFVWCSPVRGLRAVPAAVPTTPAPDALPITE